MKGHRAVFAICLFIATAAGAQKVGLGPRYQFIESQVESVTSRFENVEITASRQADGKLATRMHDAEGKIVRRALVAQKGAVLEVTTRTRAFQAFSRRGLIGGRHEGKELPTFTSVLRTADGKEDLGRLAWWSENKILAFQMKWDSQPYFVTAAELPEGWTFEPDMAWANIQLLSLAKSYEDFIAHRAKNLLPLDDPGCTGLHWLDGGVLRPCCDIHDQCYFKNGCNYRSWWFQGSWSCVACNIAAVECMTLRRYLCEYTDNCPVIGWWRDYGDNYFDCYLDSPNWCPAYCRACTIIY